jgi:hypothetical protein
MGMYTVVTNWRIGREYRGDEAYRDFLYEAGRQVVPILRNFGMLDVFVIRISDEVVKFVNVYESADLAERALATVQEVAGPFLARHLELLERSGGPTIDLPSLMREQPQDYGI